MKLRNIQNPKISQNSKRLKFKVENDVDQINNFDSLSDIETRLLYQAKCRDLNVPEVQSQYFKFKENILEVCKNRKFNMSGAQIGPLTAKVISLIMTKNENFSSYDLSQNEIGDEGARYIAHALLQRPSII